MAVVVCIRGSWRSSFKEERIIHQILSTEQGLLSQNKDDRVTVDLRYIDDKERCRSQKGKNNPQMAQLWVKRPSAAFPSFMQAAEPGFPTASAVTGIAMRRDMPPPHFHEHLIALISFSS